MDLLMNNMSKELERANQIYEQIKANVAHHKGKIVAIELDTGDYFLGDDVQDAYEKAHKKYPSKEFYFKRVGFKAVYFIGAIGA